MNTTALVSLIISAIVAPFFLMNKKGRRIENAEKLVTMLQTQIERLDSRVAKMEDRLENREKVIEQQNYVISAAFECRTPSQKCPVLIANSKFSLIKKSIENEQKNNYSARATKQQSGQHPPEPDKL